MSPRINAATCAVLLALVLSPQSVLADKPLREQFAQEFFGFPIASCYEYGYGFDILADAVFVYDQLTFFDNEGNVNRIRVKVRIEDVNYVNSNDSSKRLDDMRWGATQWLDVATGEVVQTGLYTKVTAPGWGVLAIGVGRLVIGGDGTIKFLAGKANFVEGDISKLCAYLAY